MSIQILVVSLQSPVPAKPLYNAQISGPFYFLSAMNNNYTKTYTLPQDLIPLLISRGLSIPDEQKAVSYLTNNTFTLKLKSLLAEYSTIDIKAMGFPSNWYTEPIWQ